MYQHVLYSDLCVVANGLKDSCIELLEEAHAWIELVGGLDLEVRACLIDLERKIRVFERAGLYFAHANALSSESTGVVTAIKSFVSQYQRDREQQIAAAHARFGVPADPA